MKTEQSLAKVGADLIQEAESYPQIARELTVSNDKELRYANEIVKGIKALEKEIRAGYDDIIDKAHKTWKGAIATRDSDLKPLKEAEALVKSKMVPYMEEQERKRREAEEAMRRAQEEAEAAERAAEEERQRKAREAIQDGDTKAAEEILAQPALEIVPEKVDIPETTRLEGTHSSTYWTWEEEDIDKVPRLLPNGERALILNRGPITEYVKKFKDKAKVPGLRIFQKTTIATRE